MIMWNVRIGKLDPYYPESFKRAFRETFRHECSIEPATKVVIVHECSKRLEVEASLFLKGFCAALSTPTNPG